MSPLLPSTLRRLQQIPQVPSIWEFIRRPAPASLKFQGASGSGQDLILIGDATEQILRAFESVDCEGGNETIVRALVKAMERPELPLKPVRPIRIVCADRALQMYLRGALQGLGLTFSYSPHLTVVEDFFQELQAAPSPPDHLPGVWEHTLQELATRFWDLQPWDDVAESTAVKVTINRFGVEALWACTIGTRSLDPGVVFFRSEAACHAMFSRATGLHVRPLDQIHHLDCLAIVFPDGFYGVQSQKPAALYASIHPFEGFRDFLDAEEAKLLWCAAESYLHFLKTHQHKLTNGRPKSRLKSRSILTPPEDSWGGAVTTASVLEETLSEQLDLLSQEEAEDPFDPAFQSFDCINLSSRESNLLMGSLPFQFLSTIECEGHLIDEAENTFAEHKMIPFVAIRLPASESSRMAAGLAADNMSIELALVDGRDGKDRHSSNLLVALTGLSPPRIIWQGPSHLPTPDSIVAWKKEVSETEGQCLLLIARGNPTRAQTTIHPTEIDGFFLTAFRTSEELGIGPMRQSEAIRAKGLAAVDPLNLHV